MTTPIDRLAEIAKRTEAATPGPWYAEAHRPTLTRRVVSDDHMLDANLGYLGNHNQDDARFIAHARADVPWLLAEISRLQGEVAELTAKLRIRERQLDDMDAAVIA